MRIKDYAAAASIVAKKIIGDKVLMRVGNQYLYGKQETTSSGEPIYVAAAGQQQTMQRVIVDEEKGTFRLYNPECKGYLTRIETPAYGQNPDWYLSEVRFEPLQESDLQIWYCAQQDSQSDKPRVVNLKDASMQKNVTSTDYGLHIYNWQQSWMDYPEPKVACGKGIQNGDVALNAEIIPMEE